MMNLRCKTMNSTFHQELVAQKSSWNETIEKDLHRTYKMHELFAEEGGMGQLEMQKVLCAYSVYNQKVGYCQVQIDLIS